MGRIPEQTGITGAGTYTINTAPDNRLTTLGVGQEWEQKMQEVPHCQLMQEAECT